MEEQQDHGQSVSFHAWIPCLLAMLVLFGFTAAVRIFSDKVRTGYEQASVKPFDRNFYDGLRITPVLWMIPAAGCTWGIRRMIQGRRTDALTWFLWTTIASTIVHGVLLYSLAFRTFSVDR